MLDDFQRQMQVEPGQGIIESKISMRRLNLLLFGSVTLSAACGGRTIVGSMDAGVGSAVSSRGATVTNTTTGTGTDPVLWCSDTRLSTVTGTGVCRGANTVISLGTGSAPTTATTGNATSALTVCVCQGGYTVGTVYSVCTGTGTGTGTDTYSLTGTRVACGGPTGGVCACPIIATRSLTGTSYVTSTGPMGTSTGTGIWCSSIYTDNSTETRTCTGSESSVGFGTSLDAGRTTSASTNNATGTGTSTDTLSDAGLN